VTAKGGTASELTNSGVSASSGTAVTRRTLRLRTRLLYFWRKLPERLLKVNGLNVVISSNVAVVDGMAINERQETAVGSLVVLIPERNRDRTDLYQ
jgi:hypothetical protein